MKYKRVTRSVLASKLYSIAHGFNISNLVKSIINKVLEIEVLLVIYINSKSLYKYLVKLGTI
jgi:phosphoribosyl-AMP cyclohydrolase